MVGHFNQSMYNISFRENAPSSKTGNAEKEAERKLQELKQKRNEAESEEMEKMKQKQQGAEAELEELKKKREERKKVLEEEEKQRKQEQEDKKVKEQVRSFTSTSVIVYEHTFVKHYAIHQCLLKSYTSKNRPDNDLP